MLLNLKSLFVILCLIGCTYGLARRWLQDTLLPADTLRDVTLGWAGISCLLFLLPNFWLFLLASGSVMWWLGRRQHPAVMFCGLIYAAPSLEQVIPGFGTINSLVSPSYHRTLALTTLAIWVTTKQQSQDIKAPPDGLFDKILLCYGALLLILQVKDDSATNTIRAGLYFYTDIFLVFHIARRFCLARDQIQRAVGALVFGIMVISLIGIFEMGKRWLLYGNVTNTLGLEGVDIAAYLVRGDDGLLRALTTTGHSIALGYVVQVGIMLWLGLVEAKAATPNKKALVLGMSVLACGSIASLSRGPWVGLLAALLLWFALSPQGMRRLMQFSGVAAAIFGLALLSPAQDDIINLIPWVGETDSGTIDYRQRLIEVSWVLIKENPWLGSTTFISAPIMQQMIQGQGIIDLVNTYVALALGTGLIGTAFFVLALFGPLAKGIPIYFKVMATKSAEDKVLPTTTPILRAALCLLVSTAITIGTVSSIYVIPWTYWLICGLTVGLIQQHQSNMAKT